MTQEKNSILHSTKSPKIEERGFIFIDLNDSTYISKKLSPVSYSQFISVCFKILEQRLIDSPFSIYQFVGDEAVLTWRNNTDENHYEAGIKLVFEFNIALRELYPFFIESFGVVPVFKSSIHWGSVAKTTIGELKPEVAYHGE
ncbi:MAG: hypothetical protein F6K19_06875, partial [Cyanothece sp. SIO1E1]|nr:hypothetical protein [Cyanothece sp. SIO1E1]